jgi:hypothetical protein
MNSSSLSSHVRAAPLHWHQRLQQAGRRRIASQALKVRHPMIACWI